MYAINFELFITKTKLCYSREHYNIYISYQLIY
uniref:Uncharacterized protein n=1 Tax=Arundo donax TaxID=35708 RepID=A0A0A8YJE9_ARUDO